MTIKPVPSEGFETTISVLVIGGGAAGLCAALAAHEAGAEVAIFERDPLPRGSTALSAGLIPAAETRFQKLHGIVDTPELFAGDIRKKAHGEADDAIVDLVTAQSGPTVEWLADRYGLPFSVVHDFDYPGHAARRMHGLPSRSGAELIDRLRQAVEEAGLPLIVQATVTGLFSDAERRIHGLEITRPDGTRDAIGCDTLILACNGYGGNPVLVGQHIPEMQGALYFGHPGNRGDAALWGEALGTKLLHMSGYQGHGSVAHPHGILITWATIMEGGFQVNTNGRRFSNESLGYSEQAAAVIAEPESIAFTIFDERIAIIARQFEDFRRAKASGAVIEADSIEALAVRLKLPADALGETFATVARLKQSDGADAFGRNFAGVAPLSPPFKAVRVTGALFHTQGGLAVDRYAHVLDRDAHPLPNLFAAGGAAAGVSGSRAGGYLSGNGLLTATVLGRIAGISAAKICSRLR
ncbi:FAD-dependent oxidoreductase [Bradyrhizobium sp. 186]|uniref:FAD-dependent oxidoreductase n=1 Tax=Bradyrhizobium sp. 186 TaxID=2782654 RepID=UPI002001054F|nr:FAD-dependent oxidoreductase [Bradyrhizobium sp. 186]UPK38841.1 FAD-dependent oxidoreductase [Bradyrhizobium sp. 186]